MTYSQDNNILPLNIEYDSVNTNPESIYSQPRISQLLSIS